MTGTFHRLSGASLVFAATGSAVAAIAATFTATLPDDIEFAVKVLPHRGPTHWILLWAILLPVELVAIFRLGQGWWISPLIGLALGPGTHVFFDMLSMSGVPFAPCLPAGGIPLYETGKTSETIWGITATLIGVYWGLLHLNPAESHAVAQGVAWMQNLLHSWGWLNS